jgi:hypothetical protein
MTGIEIATIASMAITVGDVLAVAGTLGSIGGALSAGNAQKAAAEQNAAMAAYEGQIAQQQATFEEAQLRRRTKLQLARQRAAIGASGLALEGSPLLALEDTAAEAELDALSIRYAANLAGVRSSAQAARDRAAGRAAQQQGRLDAVGAAFGGASKIGGFGG